MEFRIQLVTAKDTIPFEMRFMNSIQKLCVKFIKTLLPEAVCIPFGCAIIIIVGN